MNMKKMTQEHISAFVDAELADQEITAILSALRSPEQRQAWDVYHRIGDVLRSEDLACEMRPSAQARMTALLEAEPVIFAPAQKTGRMIMPPEERRSMPRSGPAFIKTAKHFFRPGMAVAATAAAVAFFAAPPLMVALNGRHAGDASQVALSTSPARSAVENGDINLKVGVLAQSKVAAGADRASADAMLRDANVDEYLFAHQRYSRSGYSNAQYTSPASFTTESTK